MKLITCEQHIRLLLNGTEQCRSGGSFDPEPVVRLFTPDAGCTWLLSEVDPDDHDIAFGLCDLGMGFPELGCVRLSEIADLRGKLGLPVERDLQWTPRGSIGAYAAAASKAGCIVPLHREGS